MGALGKAHRTATAAATDLARQVGAVARPVLAPAAVVYAAVAALPRLADGLSQLAAMDGTLERIAKFDGDLARIGSVAASLERVAAFEATLDRIASYGESLAGLAEMSTVLHQLAAALEDLGSLATSVESLQAVVGELSQTVLPLQGAAQRLGRIVGGRKAGAVGATTPGGAARGTPSSYPTLPS